MKLGVRDEPRGLIKCRPAFTLALSRRVARADLAFLTECKALRREMERRVNASLGTLVDATTNGDLEGGRLPWAAETARLSSSVGLEVATERLPAPALYVARGAT